MVQPRWSQAENGPSALLTRTETLSWLAFSLSLH